MQCLTPNGRLVFRKHILRKQDFHGKAVYSAGIEILDEELRVEDGVAKLQAAVAHSVGKAKAARPCKGIRRNRQNTGWLITAECDSPAQVRKADQVLDAKAAAKLIKASRGARMVVEPYAYTNKGTGEGKTGLRLVAVIPTLRHDVPLNLEEFGMAVAKPSNSAIIAPQPAAKPAKPAELEEEDEELLGELDAALARLEKRQELRKKEEARSAAPSLEDFEAAPQKPPPKPKPKQASKKAAAKKPKPKKAAKPKPKKPKKERALRFPKIPRLDPVKLEKLPGVFIYDIETESGVDLTKEGDARHVADPGFRIKCARVRPAGVEEDYEIRDVAGKVLVAHKAEFDRRGSLAKIPEEVEGCQWIDSKGLARYLCLPVDGLAEACDFIFGGGIRKGTMPDEEASQEEWDAYNSQDLRATDHLYQMLREVFILAVGEDAKHRMWAEMREQMEVSCQVNFTGIPIDLEFAEAGAARAKEIFGEADAFVSKATGCTSAAARAAVLAWAVEHQGLPPIRRKTEKGNPKSDKPEILKLAALPGVAGEVGKACLLRLATPLTKYEKVLQKIDARARLCNAFHYAKAISGRFSSTEVQAQNIPKAKGKDIKEASGLAAADAVQLQQSLRRMIRAPNGRLLATADLKGIELRINMHIVGHDEAFETDPLTGEVRDIYRDIAADAFHGGDKSKVSDDERQAAKICVLASQYGAAEKTITSNLGLDEEDGEKIYNGYHAMFPGLRKMMTALKNVWREEASPSILPGGIGFTAFSWRGRKLRAWRLPSGRPVVYWDVDGGSYWALSHHRNVYENFKQVMLPGGQPKREPKKQPHAGTLNAHCCSGIAADFLLHGMTNLHRRLQEEKLDAVICAHIHDELVLDCAEKDAAKALAVMQECMTTAPSWMPNIPLQTEGDIKEFLTGEDIADQFDIEEEIE